MGFSGGFWRLVCGCIEFWLAACLGFLGLGGFFLCVFCGFWVSDDIERFGVMCLFIYVSLCCRLSFRIGGFMFAWV